MSDVKVSVHGAEEIKRNMDRFVNKADRNLAFKMTQVVRKVAADAKRLAPVRTGYLRKNITHTVSRKRTFVVGIIRSNARYSIFQEFGTTRNSAHPFLRPAFTQNIDYIQSELGKAVISAAFEARIRQGTVGRNISF